MDAAKPLNYSPKPPAPGRARKLIVRSLVPVVLLFIAIGWIVNSYKITTRIYWQRQCLQFVQPPDHVVLEVNRSAVTHQEISLPEQKLFQSNFWLGSATVFLHELRTPNESRQLVGVSIGNWPISYGNGTLRLFYVVSNVSAVETRPDFDVADIKVSNGSPHSHWKFFAGQPDPANPSHFTFDYDLDGQRHTCDGWLHNDGKLVVSQRLELTASAPSQKNEPQINADSRR